MNQVLPPYVNRSADSNPVDYIKLAMTGNKSALLSSLDDNGVFEKGLWNNWMALLCNGIMKYDTAFDPITGRLLARDVRVTIHMSKQYDSMFHDALSKIASKFLNDNKLQIKAVCEGRNGELAFNQALMSVLGSCLLNGLHHEFNEIASHMIASHPKGQPFADPDVNRIIMIPSHIFQDNPDHAKSAQVRDAKVHPMYLAAMCANEKVMDKLISGGWSAEHSGYTSAIPCESNQFNNKIERTPEIKTFLDACTQAEGDLMPSVLDKIFNTLDRKEHMATPWSASSSEKLADWFINKIQSDMPLEEDQVKIGIDHGFHLAAPQEICSHAGASVHFNVISACQSHIDWAKYTDEDHPLNSNLNVSENINEMLGFSRNQGYDRTAQEILKCMWSIGHKDDLKIKHGIMQCDPLLFFTEKNEIDSVKLCLQMGLDQDFESPNGQTPFLAAQNAGNKEILELFRVHKTAQAALSILNEMGLNEQAALHL